MRWLGATIAVCIFFGIAALAASQIVPFLPLTGDVQVNTHTTGSQAGVLADCDAAGNCVLAWSSGGQDGDGSGVFARRFDRAGVPLGSEVQVNGFTSGDQWAGSVLAGEDGGFTVIWHGAGIGEDSWGGVFGRRFDAASQPLGGDFRVNSNTTGPQFFGRVAATGGGEFVVVWTGADVLGSVGVFAQRFDAAGATLGGEFLVSSQETTFEFGMGLASDASGSFVVVWGEVIPEVFVMRGVKGRRFDRQGRPLGSAFDVVASSQRLVRAASVATEPAGSFVVASSQVLVGGPYSYGYYDYAWKVRGQRFDASGAPLGLEFAGNTQGDGNQGYAGLDVSMNGSGEFVIA